MQKVKVILTVVAALMAEVAYSQNTDEGLTIVSIKAIAGLQYDRVRFPVKPNEKVRIVLTNTDEMSHNLIVTNPGKRERVVKAAIDLGEEGPGMNYVPSSTDILWSIPLVEPGQTRSVIFKAPDKIGVYPYVCTFPGHGFVMFGAMYVTDQPLPPIDQDPNIPPFRKSDSTGAMSHDTSHLTHSRHPYQTVPPYLYRILMPDAGPAAIAVSLPHGLSYCWDAGACRLRYAWQGDFLDPEDYWNKKGEHFAKILGNIFYRDKTKFPLRIGTVENIPTVDFKGYRLINAFPEFHYTIDGVEVFERIVPKIDGTGLERTFRIPAINKTIWFLFEPDDGVTYLCSQSGKWAKGALELSSEAGREFTIIMTLVDTIK